MSQAASHPVETPPSHPTAIQPHPPVVAAALRTWLRYVVPLTLLSAIAVSPALVLALRARPSLDPAGARAALTLGWEMIALAAFGQLVLVGGAAAITRARPSPSQVGALGGGLVQLARAIVPCLAAVAAVAVGGLALVVPGLVLLVLLALTGASPARGVPAALADSITAARAQLPATALAVFAMLAIDVAIGVAAQRAFVVPLPRQPAPAQLAQLRLFVRVIALALVLISPLPATVLATIRTRAAPPPP
jgi:hypothetical protein